jgi:hypothetical protein
LSSRRIRALDEEAPERNSPSLPSDFNYGVRIVGLLEIASRVYKMTFALGHELSEACGSSAKPAPTAHVYFEVWASGMPTFEMSGDDAEQYLSQVYLDPALTHQCVNNSDDDGASLLAKVDEAMTAISLGGMQRPCLTHMFRDQFLTEMTPNSLVAFWKTF